MSIGNLRPEATIQSIIGRVIVKIRKNGGTEQGRLAAAVGVTQSTWSRIERGESSLSVEQLFVAANFLGVSVSTIINEAEIAIDDLTAQGVQIRTNKVASEKSGSGAAIIGAAALGALVTAAIVNSSKNK
jgi:transcriptional regulator with XRE-family HTH domain